MARLFIGIPALKFSDMLRKIQDENNQPFLKWTKAENLHITACFIGNVKEEETTKISSLLDEISFRPFALFTEEIAAIKKRGRLSMLWLAFQKESPSSFQFLCQQLHQMFQIPLTRPPVPHVTLCRINPTHQHVHALVLPDIPKIELVANELVLFESKLKNESLVYLPLKVVPLRP